MSGTREDMRDVVLQEVDGLGAGAGPHGHGPARPGPAAPPPRVGRRPRRVRALFAVLVAVAGAGLVDARRGDDSPPAAGPAGALAPLAGPVRELWRTADLLLTEVEVVGGLLVGPGYRPNGAVEAVGIDAVTGAHAWSRSLSADGERTGGASCVTPDAADGGVGGAGPGDGLAGGTASGRVTVCVVVDAQGPVDDFSPAGMLEPTASRRVLLDPGTGRVLAADPTEPSTSVAALGSDVVSGHLDDDGHLVVRRTDPGGADVRWTFVSPEPLGATEHGRWAWVEVADGLVVAGGDFGWVLTADGEPVRAWEPSPRGGGWLETLASGLLVQPASGTGLASEVVDLHTGRGVTLPGRPFAPAVDDGSLGDAVLAQTSADRLAAHALETGRALWSAPDAGAGASGVVVVGDRVVRLRADGLEALDAATGQALWTTPATPVPQYTLLTDGRAAVCVVVRPVRGRVLGAYGLDDGRLRWEVDLAEDVDHLFVTDGLLLGLADGGLVAFG